MPVLAVVAAVATFVEGVSVVAAATTITAEVIGGAMAIGGALTLAGTVTHNPNLVKWGAVLSIAGGIGAFTESVLSDSAAVTSAADSTVSTIGDESENLATTVPEATANESAGLAGATGPAATTTAPPTATSALDAGTQPTGLLSSGDPNAANAPGAPGATDAGTTPPPPAAAPAAPPASTTPAPSSFSTNAPSTFTPNAPDTFTTPTPAQITEQNVSDMDTGGLPPPGGGAGSGSSTGYFDSLGRWVRQNPEVARAAMSGIGLLASSVVPKPLNALDRARMNNINSQTQIDQMRAGLAPGWWYGPRHG